jgi:hypothetical protein
MSAEPDSTDSSIETTNYRIGLSDIRGVGERSLITENQGESLAL